MFAISFDMVIIDLKNNYGEPYNNAYFEINKVLRKYEFYNTSNINRELRISTSPVGYIDCQLTEQDLIQGKLIKHPFNNVYNLTNNYKITLHRIK